MEAKILTQGGVLMGNLTTKQFAAYFDHTNLKPDATKQDFAQLCAQAVQYGFAMVAINPAPVKLCAGLLKDTGVHVGAAVGFPLGQNSIRTKVFETLDAIRDGADEIDYVINIAALKDKQYLLLEEEMRDIVSACRDNGVISKVIIECCYLTDEEKRRMCEMARKMRPDFVKTSTGMGPSGMKVEDVRLLVAALAGEVKVKAAGSIRQLEPALAAIEAGAQRIGSSMTKYIVDCYAASL